MFDEFGVEELQWPAQSPDLNLTFKHLWDELEYQTSMLCHLLHHTCGAFPKAAQTGLQTTELFVKKAPEQRGETLYAAFAFGKWKGNLPNGDGLQNGCA